MKSVTLYVLDEALRQCAEWRANGFELAVAINVAASNLQDLTLPGDIGRALEKWGLPSEALRIELTESVIMADPERAEEVLAELAEMGVPVSLDDFGTGFSSLTNLKRLRVDELKIDRSFVMKMETESDDAAIVESTIALAHSLNLRAVAEGVETEEASVRLAELGADLVQGFHHSRPVSPEELESWLRERMVVGMPDPDAVSVSP
jgi:EAL domain-containing protein (putative c-di-GMP-specific phosphodiesterase class I)